METTWWLSKSENPKANNKNVLLPYSPRMEKLIACGGEFRRETPAGHGATRGAFGRDNGGSIPNNMLTANNSTSSDYYHRQCRAHGLFPHPATWARQVPEFFIKLLTDEGDTVYDCFGGSNVTGAVAEELNRRWLISEKSLTYLSGSKFRFSQYENVAPDLCSI